MTTIFRGLSAGSNTMEKIPEDAPLAVVVGARKDIGSALVRELSRRGFHVVAECGPNGKANKMTDRLQQLEGVHCLTGMDISNARGVKKLSKAIGDDRPIDVLIVSVTLEPSEDLAESPDALLSSLEHAHRAFVITPTLVCFELGMKLRAGAKAAVFCSPGGSFGQMSHEKQLFMPGCNMAAMSAMSAMETVEAHLQGWLKERDVNFSLIHPGSVQQGGKPGSSAFETKFGTVVDAESCAAVCLDSMMVTPVSATPQTPPSFDRQPHEALSTPDSAAAAAAGVPAASPRPGDADCNEREASETAAPLCQSGAEGEDSEHGAVMGSGNQAASQVMP